MAVVFVWKDWLKLKVVASITTEQMKAEVESQWVCLILEN